MYQVLWPARLVASNTARSVLMVMSWMPRIIGPVLVVAAYAIIALLACECVYLQWNQVYAKPWYVVFPGFWILGNVVVSYTRLITTGPGHPPRCEETQAVEMASNTVQGDDTRVTVTREPLCIGATEFGWSCVVCAKCSRFKLPRCHHCRTCNACVMRMDHHCPWVNNCIGQNNYHLFLSFLQWAVTGVTFSACWLVRPWYHIVLNAQSARHMRAPSEYQEYFLTMSFVLSAAFTFALGLLLGCHLYFVARNQTTLEFQFEETTAPYPAVTIAGTLRATRMWTFPRFLYAAPSQIDMQTFMLDQWHAWHPEI